MSLVGSTAFSNYDRTARATGAPPLTSPHHDMDDHANPMEDVAGTPHTRATSVTQANSEAEYDKKNMAEPGESDEAELERRESLVQDLARRYTNESGGATGVHNGNPFTETSEDSPLNPASANFKARTWARSVVQLDSAGYRTSGVCFQNLSVHGFGAATDYQKDVANIWLGAVGLVRKAFGMQSKRKIDILRNFDGLVRKGEMLVVLGPPGSGCSTFLKTIAGETSGIYLEEGSYFNYQGEKPPLHASWRCNPPAAHTR